MALTDTKVRSAKPEEKEYSLVDGDGMSLLVKPNGSKYWRFRFRFGGKQHLMAFGVYPDVSLADARKKREEARKLVAAGIDPREHKRAVKEEQTKEIITFEKVAREWLITNQKWSEDHANRVKRSLEDNIFPAIGTRNITELGTRDLLIPIKAVETSGRLEVASRLQQRTTAIMRYAVQSGLIDYNPAQEMAGAVASSNRQHRPALELKRIPELLQKIDGYTGRPLTRWATELTLLIFIRSSELRFARWSELDFETSMWTIPPEREPIPGVKHSQRGSKMRTPCKYPGKKSHSLSEIFIHTDMYPEEIAMRKARFTEHQIIAVLKSVEAGRTVKDVCRDAGISEASYYNWKAKYGGMEASDIKKLKDLEEENRRLKQMFADLSLECRALKDVIEKKL